MAFAFSYVHACHQVRRATNKPQTVMRTSTKIRLKPATPPHTWRFNVHEFWRPSQLPVVVFPFELWSIDVIFLEKDILSSVVHHVRKFFLLFQRFRSPCGLKNLSGSNGIHTSIRVLHSERFSSFSQLLWRLHRLGSVIQDTFHAQNL